MKKRIFASLLCTAFLLAMTSCAEQNSPVGSVPDDNPVEDDNLSDDIVVLFTNDVHCGVDDNIGYAGLSAYKKDMTEKYRYVVLADCGDFSQGDYKGAVSKGEFMVDIMNEVGYDFAVMGNHEFDYGMEQLESNIGRLNAKVLNCNVTYVGNGKDWLSEATVPYEIRTYGDTDVAFIGISTPSSVSSSTPTHFMENGEFAYDFCSENAEKFYTNVQNYVDECREKGADYVVILSHLGMDVDVDTPFTSLELIENTNGIDVVLDAHSHVEAACWIRQNKDGEDVLISSTGTKLANIGKLVLAQNGTASVGYIDNYTKKDEAITRKIEKVYAQFDEQMNKVICHTDFDLLCTDENKVRMVRSREVAIGDFVADAYRTIGNADIGMCNGGGIRADLPRGDITYENVISVNPFGNTLCVIEVTGAEILDMLEYFYRYVQSDYVKDGRACGEDGSFQHFSGLKFTINTSVPSSAEADETDAFIGVSGERRVSDVMVLKDGAYTPIDPEAVYTLASHDYTLKNGGSGMLYFLADHKLIVDEAVADYQVLIDYIDRLGGDLSQYKTVDNRITVK